MASEQFSPERQLILANRLGGNPQQATRLASRLPDHWPRDWRALAAQLACACTETGQPQPRLLGLAGGQGAGKSTLAAALVAALAEQGVRAACLSLDDVYLTRAQRLQLASEVHPLLATRGVPGTHDLTLLQELLTTLGNRRLRLPVFNKATDDRLPLDQWRQLPESVELLILEGWCVGAAPQPAQRLARPINRLERDEDSDGRYRHYVNRALAGDYQSIWQQLDAWLFLAVPDLTAVRRWRSQQEQQLEPGLRMSEHELERFVSHYERLTLWMLETAPLQARWSLELNPDHSLKLG